MARTFTADELVTKCYQRGGYPPTSTRLTSAVWYDFLGSAVAEVWDELIAQWEDYLTKRSTATNFVAGTESYAFPSDCLKVLRVDVRSSSSDTWRPLTRYEHRQEYALEENGNGDPTHYHVEGDYVYVKPTPSSSVFQYRLVYIKCAPTFSTGSETVDGYNGWEELYVLYAVRRAKVSQDEPYAGIDGEIQRQRERLQNAAAARDAGEPMTIADADDAWEEFY